MEILSVKFNRLFYTTLEARMYLKEHQIYPYMRVERLDEHYIYIVKDKQLYPHHTTKSVGNGIQITYGYF